MPGASEGSPSEWYEQRCERKGINEARGGQRHPFRNRPPARVARRVRRTVRGGRGERIRLARRRRLAVGVPRAVRRAHAGRPHHLAGPARAPRHQPADAAPRRHRQRHRECRRGVGRQGRARDRLGRQRDLHDRCPTGHGGGSRRLHRHARPAHERRASRARRYAVAGPPIDAPRARLSRRRGAADAGAGRPYRGRRDRRPRPPLPT